MGGGAHLAGLGRRALRPRYRPDGSPGHLLSAEDRPAPIRALGVATSVLAGTGQVLLRAGAPMVGLSLLGFALHGLLVERAAAVSLRHGPAGLALLILAVALRLTLLAISLWLAARALDIDGIRLADLVRRGSGQGAESLTDAVRLVIAPMVIVYAAWSLIDWDIHVFLVQRFTMSDFGTVGGDAGNLNFVRGGWKTYIPYAIGLFVLKVLVERLYHRLRWSVLDLAIVFCECGWVILGWLVIARAIFETRLWLRTRELGRWLHDLGDRFGWLHLPFQGLWEVVGIIATQVMWPLVWIALVGLVVGWISHDEDLAVGASSARRGVRAMNRVLNTSTAGIREKWQPLWNTFRAVLGLGVVALLTIAVLHSALIYLMAWVRVLGERLLPVDLLSTPVMSDLYVDAVGAVLTPLRLAFLVAAFALVVRPRLTARSPVTASR